jgi:hypothetical protein
MSVVRRLQTEERSARTTARLFEALHRRHIRYCHFKSNEHVAAGLEGSTDLDLLVDAQQAGVVEPILAEHGFRRFAAHSSRRYVGVEDYLGLDEATGRLLHLHLHYRLIVGERFFKNYRLPWERDFLDTRVLDESARVYLADPALEWLLLVCRAALKIRWRSRAVTLLGPRRGESGAMRREHSWLRAQVVPRAPVEQARRLLGERAAGLVELAITDDMAFRRLTRLRRELRHNQTVLWTYGRSGAQAIRWSRELRWVAGTVNRRYLRRAFPYARSAPTGGAIVAVIGSDGAGKSSVSGLLYSWLRPKVDVIPIYFGSGDGPSSLLRRPLKLALDLKQRSSVPSQLDPEARRAREVSLARALWALVLAREKRSKLRTAARARERGLIVICDRYPQVQVEGVNDGPLLWRWRTSPSGLKRALARWEDEIYGLAETLVPDVVVRLLVTPETARTRRPGDDPRELEFRTQLIKNMRFDGARSGVIDVDADADLEAVMLEVKQRLWPLL